MSRRYYRLVLLPTGSFALCIALAAPASAQDSSLFGAGEKSPARAPLTLENASLFYQKFEPPKVLQLHDIVTVVVSINSRVLSEGEVENRKQVSIQAALRDWIRLDGWAIRPDPQSEGDPTVDYEQNNRFRAEGELETRNSLTFTIAAKVVDVRPNGNLIIEARQVFKNNEEIWERSLSGTIRREDVDNGNKVLSEDIADLRVHKREVGHVRDGYRRGWLQKLYDKIQLF